MEGGSHASIVVVEQERDFHVKSPVMVERCPNAGVVVVELSSHSAKGDGDSKGCVWVSMQRTDCQSSQQCTIDGLMEDRSFGCALSVRGQVARGSGSRGVDHVNLFNKVSLVALDVGFNVVDPLLCGPDLDGGLDGMGTDSKGIWGKLEDSITVIRHSLDFLGPCWEAVGGAAKGEEEQVSVAS